MIFVFITIVLPLNRVSFPSPLNLQALDFYLTGLLAKYQKWLVESPAKMEIRLDQTGNMMKEMVARQVTGVTSFLYLSSPTYLPEN